MLAKDLVSAPSLNRLDARETELGYAEARSDLEVLSQTVHKQSDEAAADT